MAIYTSDQQRTTRVIANGGVVEAANATVLDGISGEAATYVFSSNWTQVFNGAVLSFRVGVPYSVDTKLLAALTAASAPIVSA